MVCFSSYITLESLIEPDPYHTTGISNPPVEWYGRVCLPGPLILCKGCVKNKLNNSGLGACKCAIFVGSPMYADDLAVIAATAS